VRYIFLLIFLSVSILSVLSIPPYEAAGMVVFENPESYVNPFIYLALILGFTALIIFFARSKLLALLIHTITFIAMVYVLIPFIDIFSIPFSAFLTVMLIKKPNWLLMDFCAFLLSVGIATMFGISLSPVPVLILLTVLAVYDFFSVYKTKHMISLADSIARLNAPMLFVIPRGNERMMIGVGDIVMPAILAVSAQKFLKAPEFFSIKLPAIATILGGFLGLFALICIVEKKGGAHAGLPFINFGAIAGFAFSMLI
jgi:presenilin-like A22 family membrane protease